MSEGRDLKRWRVGVREGSRHGEEAAGVCLIMTRWRRVVSVSLHRSTESCGEVEGREREKKEEVEGGETCRESREVLPT